MDKSMIEDAKRYAEHCGDEYAAAYIRDLVTELEQVQIERDEALADIANVLVQRNVAKADRDKYRRMLSEVAGITDKPDGWAAAISRALNSEKSSLE